jgi:CMP/dCMP kinase
MTAGLRNRERGIVVAIDGPGGAGKSTVARRLARALDYRLLDTGALYRAVALRSREQGVAWSDEQALARIAAGLKVRFRFEDDTNHVYLGDQDVTAAIREPAISGGASQVSALPAVRAALLDLQRRLGAAGGVVVEGRDTGTVVFPDAEAKFFLTADPEVRARRRYDELRAGGSQVDLQATLTELRERDNRDSNRDVAPLSRAPDAVFVDSGSMTLDEVVASMLAVVREREQA